MRLEEIRQEIDRTDDEIRSCFLRRMELAEQVARVKMETGDSIWKPDREEALVERLTAQVPPAMRQGYACWLHKLMEVSRQHQYGLTLRCGEAPSLDCRRQPVEVHTACYAGLPCSYGEAAAQALFGDKEIIRRDTFEEVFQAVAAEEAQVGVVPLENSTAGGVNEVYDLLQTHQLYINWEYIKPVEHCLAGVPGARLEEVRQAWSHPQALAQSSCFLRKHGIQEEPVNNTAKAASLVARQKDPTVAAVCSEEAARQYGLDILARSIQHDKRNATRFVGVTRFLTVLPQHNKVSLVFACPHRSGSLAGVLGIFADYGVNLTEIHSRPDGKNPWNYIFYVECTGNLLEDRIRTMLFQLTAELPYIKILGSFHSGEEEKP
ncbi:MAG: bifunctional chorismate mutase/prephenate dehydratase [Eubacteriales bacterium]|jgi:chorismate mutase/prephenate dehydratase